MAFLSGFSETHVLLIWSVHSIINSTSNNFLPPASFLESQDSSEYHPDPLWMGPRTCFLPGQNSHAPGNLESWTNHLLPSYDEGQRHKLDSPTQEEVKKKTRRGPKFKAAESNQFSLTIKMEQKMFCCLTPSLPFSPLSPLPPTNDICRHNHLCLWKPVTHKQHFLIN